MQLLQQIIGLLLFIWRTKKIALNLFNPPVQFLNIFIFYASFQSRLTKEITCFDGIIQNLIKRGNILTICAFLFLECVINWLRFCI
jgi:hypothetical protein